MTETLIPGEFKVLVVDDEPMMRELLECEVSGLGCKTMVAGDGAEAWEILQQNTVDLVLTDIRMPRVDGLKLLETIRKELGARPAVALMSGYADVFLWDAYDKGADAFLGKPFPLAQIASLVENIISHRTEPWSGPAPDHEGTLEAANDSAQLAAADGGFRLGRGGFFVGRLTPEMRRGMNVRFLLQVNGQPPARFAGIGVIRWIRQRGAPGLPVGAGIEILWLDDGCRATVRDLIAAAAPMEFIPRSL